MNILLTIHHELDRNSGAPGAAMELADALRTLGHHVELLSYDDLPRWARGRRALFTFPILVAWRALVGRRFYDVVDCLSSDATFVAFLPKWARPKLFAVHSQGLEQLFHDRIIEDANRGGPKPSWKYPLFRGSIHLWSIAFAIRRADVVLVMNCEEKEYVLSRGWSSAAKITVTFNGVADEVLIAARDDNNEANPGFGIAFVGSYIARKGIAYLMPALTRHLQEFPNSSALLLGTSVSAKEVLQDLPVCIHDRVRVIERFNRKDLPFLLAQSHVLALPSLGEGFSLAFVEGMACGLVPIVTRGHAFDEVVKNEENGLLVDRGNSEQINEALEYLQNNRDALARMRKSAAITARQFTWDRAAQIRIKVYADFAAVHSTSDNILTASPSELDRNTL